MRYKCRFVQTNPFTGETRLGPVSEVDDVTVLQAAVQFAEIHADDDNTNVTVLVAGPGPARLTVGLSREWRVKGTK